MVLSVVWCLLDVIGLCVVRFVLLGLVDLELVLMIYCYEYV